MHKQTPSTCRTFVKPCQSESLDHSTDSWRIFKSAADSNSILNLSLPRQESEDDFIEKLRERYLDLDEDTSDSPISPNVMVANLLEAYRDQDMLLRMNEHQIPIPNFKLLIDKSKLLVEEPKTPLEQFKLEQSLNFTTANSPQFNTTLDEMNFMLEKYSEMAESPQTIVPKQKTFIVEEEIDSKVLEDKVVVSQSSNKTTVKPMGKLSQFTSTVKKNKYTNVCSPVRAYIRNRTETSNKNSTGTTGKSTNVEKTGNAKSCLMSRFCK